jgi:hypothetical protein
VVHQGEPSKPAGPEEIASVVDEVRSRRAAAGLDMTGYDVVLEADSTGEFIRREPAEPAAWADAGVTWWVESWWTLERGEDGTRELLRRVAAGPPGG